MFLSLDIRDYNNVRIAMKTASGDMHVMHVPPMLSPCLFYRQEDNITRIVQQMILFCETYNTPLRKIRALTLLFSTQEPEANKDRIKNYLCSLFTPELVYSEYKKTVLMQGMIYGCRTSISPLYRTSEKDCRYQHPNVRRKYSRKCSILNIGVLYGLSSKAKNQ